MTFVLRTCL